MRAGCLRTGPGSVGLAGPAFFELRSIEHRHAFNTFGDRARLVGRVVVDHQNFPFAAQPPSVL